MDRIINFFPEERHAQLLLDLSLNMRAIISQRLIPTVDGKRAAAIEILIGTPRAADLIAKGDVSELKELMEKSEEQGMQTFDRALYKLYKAGKINLEEALKNADSRNNLRLKITLDENLQAKSEEEAEKTSDNAKDTQPALQEAIAEPAPSIAEATTPGLDDLSLVDIDENQ